MKMPAVFPRDHYEPPWKGDSLVGILLTARRPGGHDHYKVIDQNYQWGQKCAWCLHWGIPEKDNYHFYLEPGAKHARRMSFRERHRHISGWSDAQVSRWRRSESPKSARPQTYATMVKYAVSHHVIIVAELKSPAFNTAQAAHYMVNTAKAHNHPPFFMALINMRNVRSKAKAIHLQGGQFAVIFGNHGSKKQPKDWHEWSKYVTQVWGATWTGK
jgi:hypothetical protein